MGATLRSIEGFAPHRPARRSVRLGRALAIGFPAAALAAGLCGVGLGFGEPTLTGVVLEPPGGHVIIVDPASFAWAAGIRPGQIVVAETGGAESGGWSIGTIGLDGVERAVSQGAATATVRLGLVPAILAVALGVVGLASAGGRRRRAELAGAVGLVLGAIPFAAIHDLNLGPLVAASAGLAAPLWVARWTPARAVGWALLGVAAALLAASSVARVAGLSSVESFDDLRFDWAIVAAAVAIAAGVGMTRRDVARRSTALRSVDVGGVLVGVTILVFVQLALAPPSWVPAVLLVSLAVAYRRIRRAARDWIDHLIFAEQRERAAIDASEAERSRLSHELHDDPLQAIAGVIIQLGNRPDTARERDALRTVANQLRNVATALHPPVLDDLGLVPAVESLFASRGPVDVAVDLVNSAGYLPSERPPFDVELAAYRIVQEAATNAIRHSGCRHITVWGQVGPLEVSIDVVDDGHGLREPDVERALRSGHLGLASMRRRAESVDARLAHLSRPGGGTVVRLRWTA